MGLGYLYADIKHPNVVEGQLAIVASEHVKLALYNIGCVTAARSRSVVTRLNFFPMILLDVKNMNVVHPMCAIVATKVVYFRVYEAARCRNSRGRFLPRDGRLDPGKRARVQIEDVIELSVLVWLSTKDVNLFLKSYR